MLSRHTALTLALALPCALGAQAPVITKNGDPSIGNDSIYRLASTLDADRTHHGVVLLNDAVIKLDANGRGTRTVRQVVYVNDLAGVRQYRQWVTEFDPTFSSMRLNWARVLRPDGTVVESSPYYVKEDMRLRNDEDRGWEHVGAIGLILNQVDPGLIVDVSITEQVDSMPRGMELPAFWAASARRAIVKRARYMVDVPDSFTYMAEERNLKAVRKETRAAGRRTTTWIATDVPESNANEFAPDSDGSAEGIMTHTVAKWEDVGAWYVQRALPSIALGKHGEEKFAQVIHAAHTAADTADTLFRYVVQEMPSLQLPPYLSGYRPWAPDLTITKYLGDSQDKAALLVALLRRAGIPASYVLVVSKGTRAEHSPSPQFLQGAAVLMVRGADSVYIDPVKRYLPSGTVRRGYEGALAIVIGPDNGVAIRRIPSPAAGAIVSAHSMDGGMAADRTITWRHVVKLTGAAQEGVRFTLESERTASRKEAEVLADARLDFVNGTGKDLVFSDTRSRDNVTQLSFTAVSPPQPASGGMTIVPLAFADFTTYVAAAEYLEKHKPRTLPIDIARVVGDSGATYDVRLKIPAGWEAILPPDIDTTSEFGSVARHYAKDGNELHITQKVIGARGVIPPERADALIAWLRAVSAARAPYIAIRMHTP